MSDDLISGPVELAVIEFPGSTFNGEIVPALVQLVDDQVVSILDLVLVTKDSSGAITSLEISDLPPDDAAAFDDLDGDPGGLLSDDDLTEIGETLSFGCTSMLIVWENIWARRLVEAVAGSGGRLVAHDRLDAETVAVAQRQAMSAAPQAARASNRAEQRHG